MQSSSRVPLMHGPWQGQVDSATGALVGLRHSGDASQMDWIRQPGRWERTTWVPDGAPGALSLEGQWGLVETEMSGLLCRAEFRQISALAWESIYRGSSLTVTVRREFDAAGDLFESYTLQNTAAVTVDLPLGSVSIHAPFFDQYPDAKTSLAARCHAHLWMGGHCAWVNAMRMGAQPPHLGLVLTSGSLDGYSQRGGTISDRGLLLVHPAAMKLAHGESRTVAWKLFWHHGWEDFFEKAASNDGFVRLSAKSYVVPVGQSLEIEAESNSLLEGVQLFAGSEKVESRPNGNRVTAAIPTHVPGDLRITLEHGGRKTWLQAHVVPAVDELIAARIRFIIRNQQCRKPGDLLDGAYLAYDNETGQLVHDPKWNDLTAGRERMGMGVLGALYLPLCADPELKRELAESLSRYAEFVARELEDESGLVFNDAGRVHMDRLYNQPWAAHFHLVMYRATGDRSELDRFVRVMRTYYQLGGAKFYGIGIPASAGVETLELAGRVEDRMELVANLRAHADLILETGPNYPTSEVNYEHSIVAPAVQLLFEFYRISGERQYLDAAFAQLPLLEVFSGRQPDHRLYEVAIRHWDDFWFGKWKLYGDTFPHYWSTINATVFAHAALATGDRSLFARAETVLHANLSLFDPNGRASCAHVYPLRCNGKQAGGNDPWANDQDWALVNLLTVRELSRSGDKGAGVAASV